MFYGERDVSERPWLLIFDEISLSTNLTFLLRDGNLDQGSASLQRITTAPDTIVRGEVLHCGVIVWNWSKMLRYPWTNSNNGHHEELPLDIPQLADCGGSNGTSQSYSCWVDARFQVKSSDVYSNESLIRFWHAHVWRQFTSAALICEC